MCQRAGEEREDGAGVLRLVLRVSRAALHLERRGEGCLFRCIELPCVALLGVYGNAEWARSICFVCGI